MDKKDIHEYLVYASTTLKREVEERTEQMERLQQANREELEALELLSNQERQELQGKIDELNSDTTIQGETTDRPCLIQEHSGLLSA